jgi:hypothetical protein
MTMTDESPGGLVSILADLKVTIGNMRDTVSQLNANVNKSTHMEVPRLFRAIGQVNANASGFGVIALDTPGPPAGWYWYVRRICVGGLTPTTTAAGRADVYASAMDLRVFVNNTQMSMLNWIDQAQQLPLCGSYSAGELFVLWPEQLFVIIDNGTNGQAYTARVDIQQFQDGSGPIVQQGRQ